MKVRIHWGFPDEARYHTSDVEAEALVDGSFYASGQHFGTTLRTDQMIGHTDFDPGMPVRFEVIP